MKLYTNKSSIFLLCSTFLLTSTIVMADEIDWGNVAGTTAGVIIGGALGSQVGGGNGRYVGTAVGAALGGAVGNRVAGGDGFGWREKEEPYQPDYTHGATSSANPSGVYYAGEDDYLIKQRMSDQAKRRNMIRNGEIELPYDVSNRQTSWDDPNN